MVREIENPVVAGEYYRLAPPLEDTPKNRKAWVEERKKQHEVAGFGLRVDEKCIGPYQSELREAYRLFEREHPELVDEWIEEYMAYDPQHDLYSEWRQEGLRQGRKGER